jgi:hypothetical protein
MSDLVSLDVVFLFATAVPGRFDDAKLKSIFNHRNLLHGDMTPSDVTGIKFF